jgi:methylmalonyl-CoA mutase
MNNDSKEKMLFQDFIAPTKQDWINKANIDLKGADFDKRLVWKNLNGIDLQPFYTKEDQKELLKNTGENSAQVVNYRRILVDDVTKANQLALKALEEGMTGLLFDIDTNISANQLLKDIDFNGIALSFLLNKKSLSFITSYKSFLDHHSIDPKFVKGYIDFDIFNQYLETGSLDNDLITQSSQLIGIFSDYPNFKTLTVSGTIYQDAGSNQVQEIAYTLNSLVFLIEEMTAKGCSEKEIFDNLHFILGVSSEYFVEIAKFRVFNSLLSELASKYGVVKPKVGLSAKTSVWSKSVTDPNTNMLRSTTEAMAALLGNVDGLELDPYDHEFKKSNDFSSRIAGNITTILKEESYFGKVANPVDGSYYIEELSLQMAQNALAIFKNIESSGGFIAQTENQKIQSQIAEIRMNKIKLLSQRRIAMVGVNKYPNLMETVSEDVLNHQNKNEDPKLLVRQRAGLEMEKIRYATEHFVMQKGYRPIVEIASFGQLTMRKARAAFAYDFMGVSAFEIESEKSFNSYKEAAEKTALSNSNVVVICSSDPDYQESALDFVKDFREQNSSKVLLLAGNPEGMQESLIEAGLDGFIHVRSDIYKTLSEIQQKISKTTKALEI